MNFLHSYQPPPFEPLVIRYQDKSLLVVDKPSGLLSVPGRGADKQDCLLSRVQAAGFPSARVIHRLDMSTSGLLVFALSAAMQRAMSRLFERRQIEKHYQALVAGRPEPSAGRIDLPLITDWPNRPLQKVDFESGKSAITDYRSLNHDPVQGISRVELRPLTGRSHQLRVHLQAIGHPILGDDLYAQAEIRALTERLTLHAVFLAFVHPVTGQRLELDCPTPF